MAAESVAWHMNHPEISPSKFTFVVDRIKLQHTYIIFLSHDTMADPTAFYEPEEDELLSSMAVPTYAEGDYDEDYRQHMQELEAHAFAQHQEQEQAAALESIPEDVKRVSIEARAIVRAMQSAH